MKIGYARVSSLSQDYENQVSRLKDAGCEEIFSEKQSGKSADDREQLQAALKWCRKGDTLIVAKLDRLARNTEDLLKIIRQLQEKGAHFTALDNPTIDTTSPQGEFMLTILAAVAKFERSLINSRCDEGRKAAKAKGVQFGRKAKLTDGQLDALRADVQAGQVSMQAIADKYGVARNSVYRLAGAKEAA